jgi:hypothetical protein
MLIAHWIEPAGQMVSMDFSRIYPKPTEIRLIERKRRWRS